MKGHVIEVGPNAIRRLCCGGAAVVDSEAAGAALECVDDPVALVDLRPVSVESLWRTVLKSLDCGSTERVIVVHPSWWAPTRVAAISAGAQVLAGDILMRPRSWLLRQAVPPESRYGTVVIEIADGVVVITGAAVTAETRLEDQHGVAEAIVGSIRAMATETTETVVIDAPSTVHGAGVLAVMIAEALRDFDSMVVMKIDDIGLRNVAADPVSGGGQDRGSSGDAAARHPRRSWTLALGALLIGAVLGVSALARHPAPHVGDEMPTTLLVEGHVALEVPVQWPVRRVVAGPGSARLQINSPSDPEEALHVTQSRVALATLGATAEFLKSAIDAAPAGVFVDFNAGGRTAGRPAVTYREVRSAHDIRWTVWVDKAVRISVGCQSRHGRDDAVSRECERAVRSARALG